MESVIGKLEDLEYYEVVVPHDFMNWDRVLDSMHRIFDPLNDVLINLVELEIYGTD